MAGIYAGLFVCAESRASKLQNPSNFPDFVNRVARYCRPHLPE
jgi:hypothetical protein